jgi:hypothetical protein
MKLKEKNVPKKIKKPASSIVLYVVASIIALIAVALLINNVLSFEDTVAAYAAQGYATADVLKQLVPSQLLPGIFQPIAVYGGIAFVLFAAGIINQKVSKCLILLTKVEIDNNAAEESVLEEDIICAKDMETEKQAETIEEVSEAIDNSKFIQET